MSQFGRRKKRYILGPVGLVIILWVTIWSAGFVAFTNMVPRVLGDQTTQTDGIVVLTGGTQRLNTGLDLLNEQKAKKLLISGVYHGVELKELLSISQNAPKELECCIDIGHKADDTWGNARETKDWIEKTGFQSLRLVTANYHMPRSLLEFSFFMPYTEIIAHPVFPEHVKVDEWWRWPGTANLLISEYNKYLLVWLRHKLAHLTDLEILK